MSGQVKSQLNLYLSEIGNTPLLSLAEELALAHKVKAGDSQAREQMVKANLRLVVGIARRYSGRGLCLEDLIAEGNLGLLKAVEKFEPERGNRFSTCAVPWIKLYLRRALRRLVPTVSVPTYQSDLLYKWAQVSAELQEELDRPPTEEEIAQQMGFNEDNMMTFRKVLSAYGVRSISALISSVQSVNRDCTIEDCLVDDKTLAPDAHVIREELLKLTEGWEDKVTERQAKILKMRYGLDGWEPKTLKEIGEILGLTKQRINQLLNEIVQKLGKDLKCK